MLATAAVIAGMSLLSAGCQDDDDRAAPAGGPTPGAGPSVSGAIIAGRVRGGSVRVFALKDNGDRDEELGSATTDTDGKFRMRLKRKPSGPIELEALDGEYTSEADTRITRTKVRLRTLVPRISDTEETGLVATPLTTFAAARARRLRGESPNLGAAINAGDANVREIFGIDAPTLARLVPDINATGPVAAAAVVLGALEDLAIKNDKEGADIVTALALDLSDGLPDGKQDETPVRFEGTTETIPPTLGTADFLSSVTSYTDPNNDNTDRGDDPPPVDPDATAAVREGVVAAAPPAAGLSVGSSGAVASLSFDGRQVVYVAARGSGIKALDITDPANPTINLLPALNDALGKLSPPFTNIGGVVAVPGAATPQVVLFDYDQARVIVADVRDQTIKKDTNLTGVVDAEQTCFSGGQAFISGGIPDPTRGVIWLAANNGYLPYDVATLSPDVSKKIALAPGDIIAENIGGDVSSNLLFSPNYGSPDGCDGPGALELVKLDEGRAYLMKDVDFQKAFAVGATPTSPGIPFGIVDAGSMDSIYKVGILTGEDTPRVGLIRLGDMSKFEFTSIPASGTDPARHEFAVKDPSVATAFAVESGGFPQYAGSAVESTNHLTLLMAGFSNDILVAKLDDPANPAWKGFADWKQHRATSTEYRQAFDPHAVGAVLASANNRSYGFMLSGDPGQDILMIDMQAFLDAAAAGPEGDAAHRLSSTPFDNVIVRKFSLIAAAQAKSAMTQNKRVQRTR
ncbi:MAG TPA: hypothetical protein VLI06_02320 [Solimonas sp.]|nr:hypothetical protein [Solimonas sp.]